MHISYYLFIFTLSLCFGGEKQSNSLNFYDYHAKDITGKDINMSIYKDKKILIVNVASKCGFTPQYNDLQTLHETYGNNLAVLGFPSNDFLWQEPGSNIEIQLFCQRNYKVTFQMFEKMHVKGKNQHPIYKWLSDSRLNGWNNEIPSWNFCKYLIDEEGRLIEFYKSRIEPLDTLITHHLNSNK